MPKRRAALDEPKNKRPSKRPKSQLAVTQSIVRSELRKRIDWKYTDVSDNRNVASTGVITSLYSNLVRGDTGFNNFLGNIVKPQAITLKYFLHTDQTYNSVRVMVIQWFDAGTPALSGILESTATALGTLSPISVTNKEFIKVLYDKTHLIAPSAGVAPPGTVTQGEGIAYDSIYIPGKRLRNTKYNATTNVVQDGNIYIVMVSDDSLTTYPQITYYSRVTFSDD